MSLDFFRELGIWAYLLLALLVMVEGPVATLAGAVAASSGLMKPVGVFVSASMGNLLADCLWYMLGYLGKIEWLHRYGGYVGVKASLIARVQSDVERNVKKLLFVAKLTLGFIIPTLVATGLARIPIRRWLGMLVLGETIWTGALVFLGYNFGKYVQSLERGVEIVSLIGAALFVALLLVYISRVRKRSSTKEE